MGTVILIAAISLAPAILIWWRGRRILRTLDSATLAEAWWQHRARSGQWIVFACVGLAFLAGLQTLWVAPMVLILALTAGFPARRAVLEESWSVWAYLGWIGRVIVVFACPWALLIVGPAIIDAIGPLNPVGSAVVALALVLRLAMPQRWLIAVLGARPVTGDELSELRQFAIEAGQRSTATTPQLLRLDLRGGRWINAVALVHPTQPAVAFSEPLLELTTSAEQCAIYAHELAHVEQFSPRRLRWFGAALWLLSGLAVAVIPLAQWRLGITWPALTAWVVAMLALAIWRIAKHQQQEHDSDLRALELGADPSALISSLEKLHTGARLPRRLAASEEQRASHPSLARRIQAIRRAAGEPHGVETPTDTVPTVIGVRQQPGQSVLIEADRITWLEGVPETALGDPAAMRASAAATRSRPYSALHELRVDTRRGAPALVAVDADGQRIRTPLNDTDTAQVQAALDRVDIQLAPLTKPTLVGRLAAATVFARLLGLLAAVSALLLPGGGAVAVLAVVATILPRAGWLMAAGICGIGGALLAWLRPASQWATTAPVGTLAAVTAASCAVLVLMAVARAAAIPKDRERWAWLPPGLLLAWLGLVWLAAVGWALLAGEPGLDPYHLHRWARSAESLLLFPVATAGVLLLLRPRWRWIAAVLVAALILPAVWLGSLGFRAAHVDDPFLADDQPQPMAKLTLAPELWTIEVDSFTDWIRLDPRGERLAVSSSQRISPSRPVFLRAWAVHHSSGTELAQLDAFDVQLTDDGGVLALVPAGTGLELRLADGSWSAALPDLEMAQLAFDPLTGLWAVTGTAETDDSSWELVRCSGTVASPEITTVRRSWSAPMATGTWFGDSVIVHRFPELEAENPGWWRAILAGQQTTFALLAGDDPIHLPPSHVLVTCDAIATEPEALCAAIDHGRVHLWRLTTDEPTRPQHLATVRAGFTNLTALTPRHAVLSDFTSLILIERQTGEARHLQPNASDRFLQLASITPTHLALLHRGETSEVSVHRLP